MHSPSPATEPPGRACRPALWRCTVGASASYRACCKGAFGAGDDVSFFLHRGGITSYSPCPSLGCASRCNRHRKMCMFSALWFNSGNAERMSTLVFRDSIMPVILRTSGWVHT